MGVHSGNLRGGGGSGGGGGGVNWVTWGLVTVLLLATCVRSQAYNYVLYGPICSNFPLPDPPPTGYSLWSNPKTWTKQFGGQIPGVGALAGANVTIPCGMSVLLDTNITVDTLDIQGHLRIFDFGENLRAGQLPPLLTVSASFIIVQGRFSAGYSPERFFKGKIVITLTDNPSKRNYYVTRMPLSNVTQPRASIGRKVFAVVGGWVTTYGMPGGANAPAWTTLRVPVYKNANQVLVAGNVTGLWPVGARIAIASTDFDRWQAEEFTITGVGNSGSGSFINFTNTTQYMHWGGPVQTGFANVTLDESAEVALLTRNIVIQGEQDALNPTFGGHFIVYHSPFKTTGTPAGHYIEGIELVNMGQQGSIGRYPMHMHFLLDAATSVISKNVVRNSNQRCFVVHATHNIRVSHNIGFKTKGHCFMVEDGFEHGNVFDGNLAFVQDAPTVLINSSLSGGATESDDQPSSFWISNPNNTFINNRAGGAGDSGFWYQLPSAIEGPSKDLPEAKNVKPNLLGLGGFVNNVAHSNAGPGMRTYPKGYGPDKTLEAVFKNFRAYKNPNHGVFWHNSNNLTLDGAEIADTRIGLEMKRVGYCTVRNSLFVGYTQNLGSVTAQDCRSCTSALCACEPVEGCTMPANITASNVRSTGRVNKYWSHSGVVIYGFSTLKQGWGTPSLPWPNRVLNSSFGLFQTRCNRYAAAVKISEDRFGQGTFYSSSRAVSGMKRDNVTSAIYIGPRKQVENPNTPWITASFDVGEAGDNYALTDVDGSIAGVPGSGAAIALNPNMAAPNLTGAMGYCVRNDSLVLNGYYCYKSCYRTVGITWPSEGQYTPPEDQSTPPNILISRLVDGKVIPLHYNTLFSGVPYITVNLLTSYTYKVTFVWGMPARFKVWFNDRPTCMPNLGLTLLFDRPAPSQIWSIGGAAVGGGCLTIKPSGSPVYSSTAHVCYSGALNLQVALGPSQNAQLLYTAINGTATCKCLASPPPPTPPPSPPPRPPPPPPPLRPPPPKSPQPPPPSPPRPPGNSNPSLSPPTRQSPPLPSPPAVLLRAPPPPPTPTTTPTPTPNPQSPPSGPPMLATVLWAITLPDGSGASYKQVSIGVGGTVQFVWADSAPHSVQGVDAKSTGVLPLATQGIGKSFVTQLNYAINVTFGAIGYYSYNCGVHGDGMQAFVVVSK